MTSADMNDVALQLREQIAEMKALSAQMQRDNAEFCAAMVKEFNVFTEKVNTRLNALEEKVNSRFDKLEATVVVMQNDITGLKHDVSGLYHWDYWLLSIILVVFAMPQIVAGLKALFSAIAEGIAGIMAAFKGGKADGK